MIHRKDLARSALALAVLATFGSAASAADWSDTSIGYRTGNKYAEPFNTADISKSIFNLSHASGYKYGSNFFNVDLLMSDSKDPSCFGCGSGAHEVYVVYRHTLDIGQLSGSPIKFGPVRGVGATVGFDYNTKADAGYNSKKRMLVFGPTLKFDVPGFFDVSLLVLKESNNPSVTAGAFNPGFPKSRYTYKTHPMLTGAFAVPLGSLPLTFEGFFNFIASKGKSETGADTAAETNIDVQVMYDLGPALGTPPRTIKVGFEYQYWKNKFGNNASGPAGKGAFAKTPMIRAEYHF